MLNTKEIEPLNEATTNLEEEGALLREMFSANCAKVLIIFLLVQEKTCKLVACIAVCRCRNVSTLCCKLHCNSRKIILLQI